MSIHLIGGGRDEAQCAALVAPFVDEARQAAASPQFVIALLLVLEADDETSVERFTSVLVAAGAPREAVRVAAILEGEAFAAKAVEGADGVFVGGGLTPAYHDAFADIADVVRARVAGGTPYAGFSAGAAVAATRALVGGYLIDGTEVSPEDAGEELDEIEVREGLGLVGMTIDVHAAQWGTLSRLVAAVVAGRAHSGIAIDEHTAIVIDGDDFVVRGSGHAWSVAPSESGAAVTMRR